PILQITVSTARVTVADSASRGKASPSVNDLRDEVIGACEILASPGRYPYRDFRLCLTPDGATILSSHRDDPDCHPGTASFLRHGHPFSERHGHGLPEHDGATQWTGRGAERAARRARSQQPIQSALFTDLVDRPW